VAFLTPLLLSDDCWERNMMPLIMDLDAPHAVSEELLLTARLLHPEAYSEALHGVVASPLPEMGKKDVILALYYVASRIYLEGNSKGAKQLLRKLADAYGGVLPNHRPRRVIAHTQMIEDLNEVVRSDAWKGPPDDLQARARREFIVFFAALRSSITPHDYDRRRSLLMWRELDAFHLWRYGLPEPAVAAHWMDALVYRERAAFVLSHTQQSRQLVVRTEESEDGWDSYLNRTDPGFLQPSRKRAAPDDAQTPHTPQSGTEGGAAAMAE
jgi:hypothetical protein